MEQTYPVQVRRTEIIADNTILIETSKPDGFDFIAGQYVDLRVPNMNENEDQRGRGRHMSIASCPQEDLLLFAMRLSNSPYKKYMAQLKDGDTLEITGPFGQFTIKENLNQPVVFLVGGIGATPVRSMVLDAINRNSKAPITVFASCQKPEDFAFIKEMSNVKLIQTITKPNDSWSGETGRITLDMIKKYVADDMSSIFYIVGSPSFADSMFLMLKNAGIPLRNMRMDRFTGYR
ncbi:MAG: hypothetical protein ACD_76C00162G0002 [uncultured bacterium]|nr:MAG: hypothetical protein ACD_76C00162G0002 [uncultured bacterium]HBD05389.1 hypothetical protein [Candidatus Uhrbacteria bacterium]